MSSTTVVLGGDFGNSESTLAWGTNARETVTIPSYVGTGSADELRRIRGGAGQDELRPEDYVLEHAGRSYFIGQLALEQSDDATSERGTMSRYWSGHTLRLLLAASALAFPKQRDLRIRLVTGLPVALWSRENVKRVQTCLVGTHAFTWRGSERSLTVEGAMVVMEGAAAQALAPQVNGPRAVIDIGGRTTDLYWSDESGRAVMPRCDGAPVGVEKIIDLLRADLLARYERDLSALEARRILRAYAAGEPLPVLYANGKPIDLHALIGPAATSVGEQIASFISRTWRNGERGRVASDAAQVLVVGGGVHYFGQRVKGLIEHAQASRMPEIANGAGYRAMGATLPADAWAKLKSS